MTADRCVVCAMPATRTMPDRHGDPVSYCGHHDPSDVKARP